MSRKLIIAAAMLGMSIAPAFAASNWYVVKDNPPVTGCLAVSRHAIAGEQTIAGPFGSESLAKQAMKRYGSCDVPNY